MKRTWVGPGVMLHPSGDILPGKPLPSDVSDETVARLVASGKVIEGDMPVDQSQVEADEVKAAFLRLEAAYNERGELLTAAQVTITDLADQVDAANDQLTVALVANTELTEQLAAAQVTITELTNASLSAGAGPKVNKEKPK